MLMIMEDRLVPSPSGQVMSMLPNKVSREPIFDGRVDLAVGVENDGDFGLARRGKDAVVVRPPHLLEGLGAYEQAGLKSEVIGAKKDVDSRRHRAPGHFGK